MKSTYEDKILSLLNLTPNEWVESYKLVKVNSPKGWIGTSGDRCARRMAENDEILRERHGKYTVYKIINKETLF